ncbi:MAG: type I secretion C-terminal target domain-containing protein, partial [Rubrivivax sp.]
GSGGVAAAGGSATLGANDGGSASIWTSGRTSGGGGAGVGSGSEYSAEFDGAVNATLHHYDNSGVASSAIDAARSALLDGPGGANGENRMFTQAMGRGDDLIDGGGGNDVIMGGNGNDRISGGTGNDVMYGRGGSTASGTDNDVFIWGRHDAGPNGAVDVIRDFGRSANNNDQLDVHALLEGRNGAGDQLAQWIQVISDASAPPGLAGADATAKGTLVVIDIDGAGPQHVMQQIFLSGTSLPTTDVNALIQQGVLIV